MQCLIDQDTAALCLPFSPPGTAAIIGGITVPDDRGKAALCRFPTQQFPGGDMRRAIPVLQAHAQRLATAALCLLDACDILFPDAQWFLAQHMAPGLQRADAHLGMQIVRGADVHHIRAHGREHLAPVCIHRRPAAGLRGKPGTGIRRYIAQGHHRAARAQDRVVMHCADRAQTDDRGPHARPP